LHAAVPEEFASGAPRIFMNNGEKYMSAAAFASGFTVRLAAAGLQAPLWRQGVPSRFPPANGYWDRRKFLERA